MPKIQAEAEEVSRAFTSMITYKTVAQGGEGDRRRGR